MKIRMAAFMDGPLWKIIGALFVPDILARLTVQVIKGQNAFCVVGLDLNRAPASTHF